MSQKCLEKFKVYLCYGYNNSSYQDNAMRYVLLIYGLMHVLPVTMDHRQFHYLLFNLRGTIIHSSYNVSLKNMFMVIPTLFYFSLNPRYILRVRVYFQFCCCQSIVFVSNQRRIFSEIETIQVKIKINQRMQNAQIATSYND